MTDHDDAADPTCPRIPERLRLAVSPLAPAANQVVGEHYRITVLTERLLRLEWSPTGEFEDRATQTVLHRDLGPSEFRVSRDATGLHLVTEALILDYDEGPFSASGLTIRLRGPFGPECQWRYGERFAPNQWRTGNFGGTARTLDEADGAVPLDDGVAGDIGYAIMDDSSTMALDGGWVAPRPPGNIDLYYFGHGSDAAGAVRDYYRLTGPQPLLPRWALGNWWSRYHAYSADEYEELISRFEAEKLPFSVAVVDIDWHWIDIDPAYGSGWTGYSWNTDLFPDPPAFLAWLHDHGLKVALNVHPSDGVRAFEDCYERIARRMGIDPASGRPVNFDIADPAFLLAYLEEVHHPLEDQGVDFWWLDWQQGTHSATRGLDPLWMLNHFHYLDSARRGNRPMTFSRYAGPGSHRYPIGFSGDTVVTWDSLDFQPYFTATAANIGYGWWSHDIGGHMLGVRDDELVARWFQLGAFSPINRLHSTKDVFAGKEPWKYSPVARTAMEDALRLRHRLIPYLYTMAERAHRLGEPLVRPLYHVDPSPQALTTRNAYLWGTELLVAPITSPADKHTMLGQSSAWLPAGAWTDVFTGVRYSGGRTVQFHRPLTGYPVLAKAGAIVPMTWPNDYAVGIPERLEVHIFAGADGEFTLYEDDDTARPRAVTTRIAYRDDTGEIVIDPARGALDLLPPTRTYRLVVHGLDDAETVEAPVATASGATVQLAAARRPSDNQAERRIFDLLAAAQLEYPLKNAVWTTIQSETERPRQVAALLAMDLPPALLSALMELLLADV
jgi:alpha-glucosidase (family GH31 glycosyl hydrolase)